MLKDRKFWTGMTLGCILSATVAFVQPLSAADPKPGTDPTVAAIAKVLVDMVKEQRAMSQDLREIKGHTSSMSRGISELGKTQTFNQPEPR